MIDAEDIELVVDGGQLAPGEEKRRIAPDSLSEEIDARATISFSPRALKLAVRRYRFGAAIKIKGR